MNTAEALTSFVYQLNAPVFPTLEDFNASSTSEALKWTYLVHDTVYQIVSRRTVYTQHGPSIILSRSFWACGMLKKELLQNPMMVNLAIICTTTRVENEQDWKGIQFVSTVAVSMILLTTCKLFM